MMAMKQTVPALRFSKFEGDWKIKLLGEISQKKSKKNGDNKVCLVLTNSAIQGIVNQSDYFDKDIANKNNLDGYYVVDKDDFIYNPRISVHAPVGPIKRNHIGQGVMSPLYFVFQFTDGDLDFWESFFETTYWHGYMNKIANFGARHDRMNITNGEFLKMPLPFPEKEEQREIASFLSAVSKKIEALKKQKEAMVKYKKGLMQKIFSQKVRFKDENGKEFPKWEEKKLGELTDIKTGKKDLQDKDENGDYPFFVRSKNIERINSFSFDGEAILIPGDGKIGEVYHYINGKFDYHQRVYKISNGNGIGLKYLYFYLKEYFYQHAMSFTVKATVDSLRLPIIQSFKVKVPHIVEQQKIVSCFNSLDQKIASLEKQIVLAEQWKSGLLEKMFI